MKSLKIAFAVSTTAVLLGCGGGGGSSGGTPTSTVQTGYFIDSPVKGLIYSTATQSGTTGAQGDFKFQSGENVTFKLYGTTLNTAYASLLLTPADANNVDADYTINLLRLLQTIDVDNDTSNGIELPSVAASDANYQFNLSQDIYTFETDTSVQAFLTKYASGRSLVGIKDAITHFNATLATTDASTVILDVTGKTLDVKQYDNRCSDATSSIEGSDEYVFDAGGVGYTENYYGYDFTGYTGKLGTGTCYKLAKLATKTQPFSTTGNDMFTFRAGPKFTYARMNRIGIRSATVTPSNGLESVVIIWHTPGTKQITYLRRYIKTDGVAWTADYHTIKWVYTWQ